MAPGGQDPTVRPAVAGDALGIATVHVQAWQVAYAEILPAQALAALSIDTRRARWEQILAPSQATGRSAAGWSVVADHGGQVLGFASGGPSRDADTSGTGLYAGEVFAIYVSPAHWGRGLGQRLMAACLEQLEGAGFSLATLWVLEENRRARSFYERGGWVADGARQLIELLEGAAKPIEIRYRRSMHRPT